MKVFSTKALSTSISSNKLSDVAYFITFDVLFSLVFCSFKFEVETLGKINFGSMNFSILAGSIEIDLVSCLFSSKRSSFVSVSSSFVFDAAIFLNRLLVLRPEGSKSMFLFGLNLSGLSSAAESLFYV